MRVRRRIVWFLSFVFRRAIQYFASLHGTLASQVCDRPYEIMWNFCAFKFCLFLPFVCQRRDASILRFAPWQVCFANIAPALQMLPYMQCISVATHFPLAAYLQVTSKPHICGRGYSRQQSICRSHPTHFRGRLFSFQRRAAQIPKNRRWRKQSDGFFLMMRVILFYCLRFI